LEYFQKFTEIFAIASRVHRQQILPPVLLQDVVDTGANLPPVSTTLAVHLKLRISPRIFEKI
jgi:hypothetical protein